VVVRADAIAVHFIETLVRGGRSPRPADSETEMPAVLGNGVEGPIVALGDGVAGPPLGTRVVTATGGMGGYAEQVAVAASDVIAVPEGLAPGEALALLADGRTALGLIRAAEVVAGDRVLITAAAGGVGSLLVQRARSVGARHVIALAGGERKLALARELGADIAIDYTREHWVDEVRAAVGEVDVLLDGVSGPIGSATLALVARGGRYAAFGVAGGRFADTTDFVERGGTVVPGSALVRGPEDNHALVEQALADAVGGRWHPVIGQRVPLSEAAAAHAAIESRQTIGKTLLIP
jgi:NADPH2:quinone reductase